MGRKAAVEWNSVPTTEGGTIVAKGCHLINFVPVSLSMGTMIYEEIFQIVI